MKITVRAFSGMRPVSADDLLRPGEAVSAVNTYLSGGELAPYKQTTLVTSLTSASVLKTIYRYGIDNANETQFWFQSTNEANFVKAPIDGDTEERTYYTGVLAYPAKTKSDIATSASPYPTNSLPMGNGRPSAAPSLAVTGTATEPTSPVEYVAYVVTFVNAWGEESPPSPATGTVSWQAGQSISVTALPTTSVASYPGNTTKPQTWTGKRLYRSATGTSGSAQFLLVNTTGDIPIATTSYTDTKATADLGEVIQSRYWLEPPDTMVGLTQMANGVLAGYTGNTVCFSEPFVPYAWPVRYQQSVDATIVGMASFNQSLLVATKRSLYVFTGADPSSITSERLAIPQTCVSKRSMVEMMGGVVFATPDGLGYIGPSGFKLLTDGLMTRRDWQAYKPESMHAYESDNRYICFYDTGTVTGGLVLELGSEPSFCELNFYATAGFRDRGRDALYLCVNGSGSTREVRKWDASASNLSMTWTSGVFRVPYPANMAAARLVASGSTNFELLADGAVVYGPVTITSSAPFRLPAGYRSMRFQVRLSGTNNVQSIEVASSMSELGESQ